jgi:hypothetical protein
MPLPNAQLPVPRNLRVTFYYEATQDSWVGGVQVYAIHVAAGANNRLVERVQVCAGIVQQGSLEQVGKVNVPFTLYAPGTQGTSDAARLLASDTLERVAGFRPDVKDFILLESSQSAGRKFENLAGSDRPPVAPVHKDVRVGFRVPVGQGC